MRESANSARRYLAVPVLGVWLVACGGVSSSGAGGAGGTTGAGGQGGGATGSAGTGATAGTSGGAGTGATAGTSGGAGTGAAAGTTGGAGTGATAGTAGGAGTGAAAGTTGSAGSSARGGTTGSAGSGGRGGTTGGAGTGAAAGTTGSAGSTGTGGAPAMPSAGCTAASAPASGHYTIDVGGTSREYILTLPANYDPHHPYRLIFAFHGGSYNAQWVVDGGAPQSGPYYGIQSEANNAAILVAPQALSSSWTNQNGRDIDYVVAMVSRFESQLCVDQSRIFATGFSMGGIMTIAVGCGEGAIFRAVAPMSGQINGTCAGTHPIAYWASHGMSDPTISISNGQAARDAFLAINHCGTQTTAGNPAGCLDYQGCDPGYPVTWCPFAGVHEPAPFAGTAIWRFLSQF